MEIAFAFFSSGYYDVSIPQVCHTYPMDSDKCTVPLRTVGCPIRKSPDRRLLTTPRGISVLVPRSEEHTSELQSRFDLVCRLLLEKKKKNFTYMFYCTTD